MALDITGKIVQLLELQSGVSSRGEWKKQEFILETEEQYPKKVCISLWGDRINDISGIQIGRELITVSIIVESREYNGKWYTDIRAWKIQRGPSVSTGPAPSAGPTFAASSSPTSSPSPSSPSPAGTPERTTYEWTNTDDSDIDDLPF